MDTVIFIAVSILFIIVSFIVGRVTVKHQEQLNNDKVLQQRALIEEDIEVKQQISKKIEIEYEAKKKLIDDARESAQKAYQEKMEALEYQYKRAQEDLEKDYNQSNKDYQERHDELVRQLQEESIYVLQEFNSLKATRDAAIEAARKEREVQEQPDKYCIPMGDEEVHDIEYLNNVMPKLNHPEVLGKYIWSVYYQKKIKPFATNILGQEDVCGIYKITNQLTGEAYIGQSKNVYKRWTEHLRCGVGAVPVSNSNQLYFSMKRDGAWNFSFELLEACQPEELDQKERQFIDLYSSDIVGLNSKRGNQ